MVDKIKLLIEGGLALIFSIWLDLAVAAPIIDSAFESGLITLQESADQHVIILWLLLPRIIEIGGAYGIAVAFVEYLDKLVS